MKKILLLLAFVAVSTNTYCQGKTAVFGVVSNTENNFMKNLQVNLVDKNDFIVQSILTNELGEYGFEDVDAGVYSLQLINENDTMPLFNNLKILAKQPIVQNFVIKTNNKTKSTRNGALVNTNIIASDKIEKLAVNNPSDALLLNSAYNASRSNTEKGNTKIMIDGQIIDNANNINIIPGTIDAIKR